ncbi:quinolinate synthase NadA [bacterium]|nr:quinolinate synthase NadA [bacterium]
MILPDKYRGTSDQELKKRIAAAKKEYKDKLVILGHHYQRDEIIEFSDFVGDSFKLAQDAAHEENATHIIFCGVHFMAEAARIVCSEKQRVYLPDKNAGCPMAEMATLDEVEGAWEALSKLTDISKIIPITYMNSTADIKAFCGKNNGIVCTSSNAAKLFDWAFKRGEKIFFLPDEHLGTNTAIEKGLEGTQIVKWKRNETSGGLNPDTIEKAKVITWDGFCHVHTFFTEEHVEETREKYPDCKIIVHPECKKEIVNTSDASGSTEQIKRYVESAPPESTIIIGTEINMVNRLKNENPNKNIIPLARSMCPNMFKISLNNLCWTLENLGNVNEVIVDNKIATNAKIALFRMLNPDKEI